MIRRRTSSRIRQLGGITISCRSGGSGVPAPMTRTAYVASTGDDMTAAINDPGAPFATLMAAQTALTAEYPDGPLTFVFADDHGQTVEDFSYVAGRGALITIKAATGTVTFGAGLELGMGDSTTNLRVRGLHGVTLRWMPNTVQTATNAGVVDSDSALTVICIGQSASAVTNKPSTPSAAAGANGYDSSHPRGDDANANGQPGETAGNGGYGRSITLNGAFVCAINQNGGDGGAGGPGGDAANAAGGNGWDASILTDNTTGGDGGDADASGGDGGYGGNGGNGGDVTLMNGATLGTHSQAGGAAGGGGIGGAPATATAGTGGAGGSGGGDDGFGGAYPPGNPGANGTARATPGNTGPSGSPGTDGSIL